MKVFCYGTLQEASVQLELIGRTVEGPITSIEGYIVVRDYIDPEDGLPYPRIIKHDNGCVYGRVLEFTLDEINVLSEYETEMYSMETITTKDGQDVFVYMPSYKKGTYKIKELELEKKFFVGNKEFIIEAHQDESGFFNIEVFDGDNWDYYCTTNTPQISINEAIKSITEHRAQQ
jgi:gamma-glutamylcyclotransferase (GGCT)/AIG2-like uncharacterized protein YtfP